MHCFVGSHHCCIRSICYFFYKNFTAIFPVVCYIFYTGFSGTQLYNDTSISAFNLAFTSLPILAYGLLDQDVTRELALQNPRVYLAGPQDEHLNTRTFLTWMLEAANAAVVILIVLWAQAYMCLSPKAHEVSKAMLGMMCYTCVLAIVTCRICVETTSWTWIHFFTYSISIVLWFVFLIVEGLVAKGVLTDGTLYWDIFYMLRWPGFYFTVILTTFAAIMPSLVVRVYLSLYHPTETEKVRQELHEILAVEETEAQYAEHRKVSRASDVFSNVGRNDNDEGADDRVDPSAWKVIKGEETLTPKPLARFKAAIRATQFVSRASRLHSNMAMARHTTDEYTSHQSAPGEDMARSFEI